MVQKIPIRAMPETTLFITNNKTVTPAILIAWATAIKRSR